MVHFNIVNIVGKGYVHPFAKIYKTQDYYNDSSWQNRLQHEFTDSTGPTRNLLATDQRTSVNFDPWYELLYVSRECDIHVA